MNNSSFLVERAVGRFSCLAEVDVTSVSTGERLAAIISNLSTRGCYIDTPDGFPVGTELRLQVHHPGGTFELVGRTIHKGSGYGMGVVFDKMTEEQRSPIDAWLAELECKIK